MALNDPPIQDNVLTSLYRFTQSWVRWFVDVARAHNGRFTWFDYADSATGTTPINHTGGATNTYLTNDGLGASTSSYNKSGAGAVYDTSANEFDFSGLKIGDTVTVRVDLTITTAVNNQEYRIEADCAVGSGIDYTLPVGTGYHKTAGTYQHISLYEMYIGNTGTRDFPTKLRFESADNATIRVNGWWVKVTTV